MNQRDRNKAESPAEQQKENQPDREIALKLRRSLLQDKTLATYAQRSPLIHEKGRHFCAGEPLLNANQNVVDLSWCSTRVLVETRKSRYPSQAQRQLKRWKSVRSHLPPRRAWDPSQRSFVWAFCEERYSISIKPARPAKL